MIGWLLRHRRHWVDAAHAGLVAGALAASFWLRFEFTLAAPYPRMLAESLPLVIAAKLAVFRVFGLRDVAWRYFGFADLLRIGVANVAASAAAALAVRPLIGSGFPRSIHVIDLLIAGALLVGAHAAAKLYFDRGRRGPGSRRRVAIYGAGRAGAALLQELGAGPSSGLEVCGLFDDDPAKRHLRVHGVRVWGGFPELAAALRGGGIEALLIALPASSGDRVAAIVEQCRRARVRVERVAAAVECASGAARRRIRDLSLEDLLNRRTLEVDAARLGARIGGRVALVSGAGGSIGSELCRQLARYRPAALIGLDHSESALFEIDREMRAGFPATRFHPELGSIRDARRLEEIFRGYRPDAVYHAAAYKHVPLMETQVLEAVANNVFGTRNLLRAAAEAGAAELVLISSDKAVKPANVMGATKRVAELIAQAEAGGLRTLAVRFGNVLGSSGSVVPLFARQIAAGGPVEVTHPEMRRFFMTIPEAAQLVLEAAAMGRGGEVFVLDMGEPIRIADLARRMMLLSGLDPERMRIEYTGVRPGEKLDEELSAYQEDTVPTRHPQIRIFAGPRIAAPALAAGLEALRGAVEEQDPGGVLLCLKELVPEYNPSGLVLEQSLRQPLRGAYA